MGGFDSGAYRSHGDILDRLPQRQSTWIPTERDWRYASGVFQHADFEASPRYRTTRDELDYGYQTAWALKDADKYATTSGSDTDGDEAILRQVIPPNSITKNSPGFRSPTSSRKSGDAHVPAATRLHLHLASDSIAIMDQTMDNSSPTPLTPIFLDDDSSRAMSRTPKMPLTPHFASTISSKDLMSPTAILSDEKWHDETCDFNMTAIRATLRDPDEKPCELVKNYNWYPEAVPVDALLPPGVPLSAKELCAYYPHHVRWQDVMLRLTHNDYRGPDILGIQTFFRGGPQDHIQPAMMNQIQRDAVRIVLPGFKTTGYEGKGDANPYTDHLKPGAYLEKKLKGYMVPTFDDLLRGLIHLPTGKDVRGLTQCLAWYIDVCSNFTPRLEFNVLHTQTLIRALRQPLEPIGSRNIDKLVLKDWRDHGMFENDKIPAATHGSGHGRSNEHHTDQCLRSQAIFNIHKDPIDLRMHVHIPIRHILAFPFIALHGIVGEAFQLGIDNAERRRTVRKCSATPLKHAPAHKVEREDTPHCTPKRLRQAELYGVLPPTPTPKRQRKLEDSAGLPVMRTPKRPPVSPITPRAPTGRFTLTPSTRIPIKSESSPLKRDSAHPSLP